MSQRLALFVLVLLMGCTTHSVKNPSAVKTEMFPDGSYQHDVLLELKSGRDFHFNGVVQIKKPALVLAGLSPLGTTLFRIRDDGLATPTSVNVEIYTDQLKPYENQVRQFYGTLKAILQAPSSEAAEREIATPSGPAHMKFEHFDEHGIPDEIQLEAEPFSLHIKVISYEI